MLYEVITLAEVGEQLHAPGQIVTQAEVSRAIPVRLRAGHRSYRTAITGLAEGAQLQRILDADRNNFV